MTEFSCPACGANLSFVSKSSISVVCQYCRCLAVKTNMDLKALGDIADLQDEVTILQIHTSGVYKGRKFTLTGRVQKQWAEGYWSEWCASFNDGTHGWLAEAQGFYAFLTALEDKAPDFKTIKIDQELSFGKQLFSVADIKEARVISTEGELPFVCRAGDVVQSVDLSARDDSDEFASIEYSSDGSVSLFVGQLYEVDDLALTNLRVIEGW